MWLIEALKLDFDVTVMTTGGWDLQALNGLLRNNVGQDEVKVRIAPVPFLVQRLSAAALRGACFQRFARQIAGEYDIRISAYNTTDWGLPAIHFIADFSWNQEIREQFHPPIPGVHLSRHLGEASLPESCRRIWKSFRPKCSSRRYGDCQFPLDRGNREGVLWRGLRRRYVPSVSENFPRFHGIKRNKRL